MREKNCSNAVERVLDLELLQDLANPIARL